MPGVSNDRFGVFEGLRSRSDIIVAYKRAFDYDYPQYD